VAPDPNDGPTLSASPLVWLTAVVLLLGSALAASITPAGAALASGRAAIQLRPGAIKELARGKLLVAGRNLGDPNFAESVVLLADRTPQGAMGLIINRRLDVPLARVLPDLKTGQGASNLAFLGGPVESSGVMALVRLDAPQPDSRVVFADVYQITGRRLLDELIAKGTGPDRFRVYVGYAGWGPGQLEKETAQGSWHVFDGDPTVVFDPNPESLWRREIPRTEERMALSSR
jgi:putative transcriptional regulator